MSFPEKILCPKSLEGSSKEKPKENLQKYKPPKTNIMTMENHHLQ